MGAKIEGIGTDRLVIQGVDKLHGAKHTVIPDRIEAGTFLCAVAAAGGDVTLRNVRPLILEAVIEKLREAGVTIEEGDDWMRVRMDKRPSAVSFRTVRIPGVPDRHAGAVHGAQHASPTAPRKSSRRSSRTASCTCRN